MNHSLLVNSVFNVCLISILQYVVSPQCIQCTIIMCLRCAIGGIEVPIHSFWMINLLVWSGLLVCRWHIQGECLTDNSDNLLLLAKKIEWPRTYCKCCFLHNAFPFSTQNCSLTKSPRKSKLRKYVKFA